MGGGLVLIEPPSQSIEDRVERHLGSGGGGPILLVLRSPGEMRVLAIGAELAQRLGGRGIRLNSLVLATRKDMLGSPLGRACTDEELVAVAEFLLGEDSSYMTGAVLRLDGGAAAGVARYEGASG